VLGVAILAGAMVAAVVEKLCKSLGPATMAVSLLTPLVVASEATLCAQPEQSSNSVVISGHLVDTP